MTTENSWEGRFDSVFDLDDYGSSKAVQTKVKDFIRKEIEAAEQRGRDMAVDYVGREKRIAYVNEFGDIDHDAITVDKADLEAARSLPDQHEGV